MCKLRASLRRQVVSSLAPSSGRKYSFFDNLDLCNDHRFRRNNPGDATFTVCQMWRDPKFSCSANAHSLNTVENSIDQVFPIDPQIRD